MTCVNVINNLDKPSSLFTTIYELMYKSVEFNLFHNLNTIASYQYKSAFINRQRINMVACLTEIMANCKFILCTS